MDDFQEEGDQFDAADTGAKDDNEDQFFDNLEDAAAALADDEGPEAEEADGDKPEDDADPDEGADEITLTDGTKTTLAELEKGLMRQADYTRKTTELAEERAQVKAERETHQKRAKSFDLTFQKLQQFAQGLLPPEPPLQLAQQNPGEYQFQLALRQKAMAEIQQLMTVQQEAEGHLRDGAQEQFARVKEAEAAKLLKAMPKLKDEAARSKFDADVKATAAEFGFSEDEITRTIDSRVLRLVHYARQGKIAERNRISAIMRRASPPRNGPVPTAAQPKPASGRLPKSGPLTVSQAAQLDWD